MEYDVCKKPPHSNPPYYDELAVFRASQLHPSFIVYFDRRPRRLLWIDTKDNRVERAAMLEGQAGGGGGRGLAEAALLQRTPLMICWEESSQAGMRWLEEHEEEVGDSPESHFRMIVSRRLFGEMMEEMKKSKRWRQRYPPILVYHGGNEEETRELRSAIRRGGRPNIMESRNAAVAVGFGRMQGGWVDC
jgi:hypothetical protein